MITLSQVRPDEQVKVGTTSGLVAGTRMFTFDGGEGTPDWRGWKITITEMNGSVLVAGVDYMWDIENADFEFVNPQARFESNQWYNVKFDRPLGSVSNYVDTIINKSHFVGDISISNTDHAEVEEKIMYFTRLHESELLIKLMGYSLYKAFLSENTARMLKIKQGSEYIQNSVTQVWEGLDPQGTTSLLADYIWYRIQEATFIKKTGISSGAMKIEGGITAPPVEDMLRVWRRFSYKCQNFSTFLISSVDGNYVFPEYNYNVMMQASYFTKPLNSFGL